MEQLILKAVLNLIKEDKTLPTTTEIGSYLYMPYGTLLKKLKEMTKNEILYAKNLSFQGKPYVYTINQKVFPTVLKQIQPKDLQKGNLIFDGFSTIEYLGIHKGKYFGKDWTFGGVYGFGPEVKNIWIA
jgi:hypothetical protein